MARCYARLGKMDEAKRESEIAKRMREYSDKVQQALDVIQNSPDNPEAYMALALVYLEFGDDEKAAQQYMTAIDINPNFMEAYNRLADIFIKGGDLNQAAELYNQAIKAKPDYITAYTMLGLIYKELGRLSDSSKQLDLALKLAKKATDMSPTAENFNSLAFIYFAKGQYDESEKSLKKAISLDPDNKKYAQQLEQINESRKARKPEK